jgi:hypothetical protein
MDMNNMKYDSILQLPCNNYHLMSWVKIIYVCGNLYLNSCCTHLRIFLNSKFYYFMFKCWILFKPVLGGVDGNLHFPVPSMNRLNQTEPATFSIMLCWIFFRDSDFLFILLYTNSNTNTDVVACLFCLIWIYEKQDQQGRAVFN